MTHLAATRSAPYRTMSTFPFIIKCPAALSAMRWMGTDSLRSEPDERVKHGGGPRRAGAQSLTASAPKP